MALSNETQKWLDDLKREGGLTDEAFNAIKASLDNPKADEFVKGSALRQSDYSRQMGTVQAAQKAVEDAQRDLKLKEDNVAAYKSTLDGWKTEKEPLFIKAVKDAELAATRETAAINRLKSLALANGLDENEVLKDINVPVNPNPNPNPAPGFDTSKFLTADQLNAHVQKAARETAFVDATIMDLAGEYRLLYGKDIPPGWGRAVVEGAIKSGLTLNDYVSKEYKFDEKRTQAAEAGIQARIDAAVTANTAKLNSEHILSGQNPGGVPSGANSPVFKQENIMKPLAPDHQAGGGITAAIAAHSAGKYRS